MIYFLLILLLVTNIGGRTRKQRPFCMIEGDIRCPRKSCTDSSNCLNKPSSSLIGPMLNLKRSYANGPKDFNTLWPTRVIPYRLDYDYPSNQLSILQSAISTIEAATCLRFVRLASGQASNGDYVSIVRDKSCWSDVGRLGGEQKISLDLDCFNEKTVYHELLHTIGFWHEHNRPDRDSYVRIVRENIDPASLSNFKKRAEYTAEVGPWNYDYFSVMHYKANAYSRDGSSPTIVPLDSTIRSEDLGSSTTLTAQDLAKINKLYKCDVRVCSLPNLGTHVILTSETGLSEYRVGSIVTYACESSAYSMIGSSSQTCLSTGLWSGQSPRCLPIVSHYCDFESGICGWTTASGDVNWELASGRGHYRSGTGPINDLTLGNLDGHFLRLDTQNLEEGLKAAISTPVLPVTSPRTPFCVSFGYYMWGSTIGTLRVIGNTKSGLNQELFSRTGSVGPYWVIGKATFSPDSNFWLTFEATIGSDLGDVAVDDIAIEPCSGSETFSRMFTKLKSRYRMPG